jgi:luciferase family oxidoreductase group 1
VQLGVVDQSPIPAGSTFADALANSVDLARRCEALGYRRYWVAEHHASEGLAGTTPEILIGHLATVTSSLRLGSGGVMLTHYSPLKVAETFRMLCTLHGDRIDVGVGRAPGTDHRTMLALARGGALADIRFYPNMVDELARLLDGLAPVWILASSVDSASYAAHLGLPLSWAYFIATTDGGPLLDAYRAQYRPSQWWPEPMANVGVSVICGDTDADAERIASSVRLWRRLGLRGPIPSLDEALAAGVDTRLDVMPGRQPMVVGSPERCAEALTAIGDHHGVDEVLAVTICHRHDDRVRSYELLAKVFGLTA